MMKWLKEFKLYREHSKNLKKIAEQDKSFLINMFADIDLLERVINELNKDDRLKATFTMPDGSKLELQISKDKQRKNINWDA